MAGESDPEYEDALSEIISVDEYSSLTAKDRDNKKTNKENGKSGKIIPQGVAPGFFDVNFEEYLKDGLSPTQIRKFQQKVLDAAEATIKMKAKNESAGFNSSKGFPTLGVSIGFFTATLTVLKGIIDSGPDGVGQFYTFLLVLLGWMIVLQISAVVLTIITMIITHYPKTDELIKGQMSALLSAISVTLVFSQAALTAFEVNSLRFDDQTNSGVQGEGISEPVPEF